MDFFSFVKEKLNVEVPLYLRNILKHAGYDNRFALANITDKEINQIEFFSKTQLQNILSKKSNVNYEELYDIYSDSIDDFIILPGHRKLLLAIGEMCGEENNKMKLKEAFINEDYNAKKRKIANLCVPGPSDDLGPEIGETTSTSVVKSTDPVQDETKFVYDSCYQWIKKFSETLSEPDQNKVIQTLHFLDIKIPSVPADDTLYFAYIKCSLCQGEIKTQKRARREGYSTWFLSNFYKHFRSHFAERPVEKKIGSVFKNQNQNSLSFREEEIDNLSFEESLTGYENNFKQEMQD